MGVHGSEKRIAVLGISAFYHDSAAALVVDGDIVAAAQEERFTRKKHDRAFPENAVRYVLSEYGLTPADLGAVVFYEKPILKFERLLETYHRSAPRGVSSFIAAMSEWGAGKLFTRRLIREGVEKACETPLKHDTPLLFSEHHLSHAASAFYPSPFTDAAILTADGVGEWATTTIGRGAGSTIEMHKEMRFPHSLGLLYSAFTQYCGFRINDGEYKLMGLAPYGNKDGTRVREYRRKIEEHLIGLKDDGSLFLNMDYFAFATTLRTVRDDAWTTLFDVPPRTPYQEISQPYMDLALAIQEVTEETMVRLARTARKDTGSKNLVMAGGVALNCVANSRIRDANIFENIWVQPAAGDAGGALGAALLGYHVYFEKARTISPNDSMHGSYLGPAYSDEDAVRMAHAFDAPYVRFDDFDALAADIAKKLAAGSVIGWMQGKMEWGPRALGNRSILADPRDGGMQKKLNEKIKHRESFRPFAPSVLEECANDYFDMGTTSRMPYMLFTAPVVEERRTRGIKNIGSYSDIPAVTHRDYSARVQTVTPETNPRFAALIKAFREETGYGLLVNTSFNVSDEPIVRTPEDAYRCFMNTDIDFLVIGNLLFDRKKQPV
jgi:carbamoyltransferase